MRKEKIVSKHQVEDSKAAAICKSPELDISEFRRAGERLKSVLYKTDLIHSHIFSEESGNQVYIKPENLQITGSFKIRGAYNKAARLTDDEKKRGIISASAGNHAQGVAFAAQELGVEAIIVMPRSTPLIKVDATKNYGARVILAGDCYDDAYAEAKRLEKEEGYVFVHPFDDLDVIAGQGTIALEILEELPDADCILVPIGGGGLISGVAAAAKAINPDIKIIGVEPEGADAMKVSLENNSVCQLSSVKTIADGVAVKQPGDITYSIIREYVDEIVTVSDVEIMEYFLILLEKHKLISENSGVLSLAALKKIRERGKKVVSLVSGGNIDVVTIAAMIDRGLVSRGRIFCFSVELIDRPGELLRISEILADLNANVIKLDHNQFKTIERFMNVQLEVTVETNGHEHIKQINKELKKRGYTITRVY